MIRDFNLLGTTSRGFGRAACSELRFLLEQVGDPTPFVKKSGVAGLIAARTVLNPFEAVKKLREILVERPYEFRYLFRVIPIERVVRTDLAEIVSAVVELNSRICENEAFRVTVEKRFTPLHTRDLVEAVAKNIKRRVNLEEPDKIVLLEVVGESTGISLLAPNDILLVLKEKVL